MQCVWTVQYVRNHSYYNIIYIMYTLQSCMFTYVGTFMGHSQKNIYTCKYGYNSSKGIQYIVDPVRTSEGQPSVHETLRMPTTRECEPLDSNHTKPTSTRQRPMYCMERDPRKRTTTAHRENRQNVPRYKSLFHDTEPVYDILVRTNTLNTMTNTTVTGLIFPRSHGTDS